MLRKTKSMAFEGIKKEGRELAQEINKINETTQVQRGQRTPTVNLIDRRNSRDAAAGTKAIAMEEGTETKAVLQRMETSQVHPKTPATSSAQKKTITNLVPEYDSDSDAEDDAKDIAEVRKPSSSMEPPCKPAFSVGPPGKPASSMGLSSKPASSIGLPTIPSSSANPPSRPASLMGPPKLPASATRVKKKEVADQSAAAEAPGQGKRFWSIDMLPLERYTPDGRRIW